MQLTAVSQSTEQLGTVTIRSRLAAAVRDRWQQLRQEYRRRATARLLHGLEDRTLKDIGLTRGEIDSIVRDPARERWPERVYLGPRTF